ncbi:MAG: hypothetical protein GW941_02635 [Candidatus Pacebacteria bacterium]|nr:hypothetical protein [Candidatus Paceibacterota bacterium]
MKTNLLSLAVIIAALSIAGSVITATNIMTKDKLQIAKSEAVQGCYVVTNGLRKSESDKYSLEETQINKQTLEECITLKGF